MQLSITKVLNSAAIIGGKYDGSFAVTLEILFDGDKESPFAFTLISNDLHLHCDSFDVETKHAIQTLFPSCNLIDETIDIDFDAIAREYLKRNPGSKIYIDGEEI